MRGYDFLIHDVIIGLTRIKIDLKKWGLEPHKLIIFDVQTRLDDILNHLRNHANISVIGGSYDSSTFKLKHATWRNWVRYYWRKIMYGRKKGRFK